MKGYIGVTSREWFNYLAKNNIQSEINFWRKNTNRFKVLESGEQFFFLVKNEKGNSSEREVLGMATYLRFEVNSAHEAWSKYHEGNGDLDKERYLTRMQEMFRNDLKDDKIGCIILSNFQVFSRPVRLSSLQIDFQNSIVSGKTITHTEVEKIKDTGIGTYNNLVRELHEVYQVGFTEDDESFPEGKQVLREHLIRERNPKLIQRAKELYKLEHGKLTCQVCGFDYHLKYGEIGYDYIEGHHTKPISEMNLGEETKPEDIAMVCANCHRMLHRRRPWLTIEELTKLTKK